MEKQNRGCLRVASRRSPLALRQVDEVVGILKDFYPHIKSQTICIDTYGDIDRLTPISDIEGSDFFTREIDEALLQGEADLAVHSAKDLPEKIPEGLFIAAITESIDPYDALVARDNLKLSQLAQGAKIGASSQRRKRQLKAYREDFQIIDIRGNIEERLQLFDSSVDRGLWTVDYKLDAVIIAACALKRLGLEHRISQSLPFEILRPHPLQGSLAVVTRCEDKDLIRLLARIDTREKVFA